MQTRTVPKDKPKWYNVRWRISTSLVNIARKIHPDNPEVKAFWMDVMVDGLVAGQSIVRVKPEDFFKERGE